MFEPDVTDLVRQKEETYPLLSGEAEVWRPYLVVVRDGSEWLLLYSVLATSEEDAQKRVEKQITAPEQWVYRVNEAQPFEKVATCTLAIQREFAWKG